MFAAQQKSLKQKDNSISISALEKITLAKGGSSFLYYRACLENAPKQTEKDLIYHLGGLMQLGNDIFDVYKDYQDNIHTLATKTTDIKDLRRYFQQELDKTFELAEACSYSSKNIRKFLKIISLGIARVFVCLDQFEELQKIAMGNLKLKNIEEKS